LGASTRAAAREEDEEEKENGITDLINCRWMGYLSKKDPAAAFRSKMI
jgi:hypothetical protein